LRTIAVAALTSRAGLLVPAKAMNIAAFDQIFMRLPCADAPSRALSGFELEVRDVGHIARYATSKSLVLLDELGRGTCPREGMAYARAVILHLNAIGATTVFATHLHDLLDAPELQLLPQLTLDDNHMVRGGARRTSHAMRVVKRHNYPTNVLQVMARLLETSQSQQQSEPQSEPQSESQSGPQPQRSQSQQQYQQSQPQQAFSMAVEIASSVIGTEPLHVVAKETLIPPNVMKHDAALYVIEEHDGRVYVGETNNVLRRRGEHKHRTYNARSGRIAVWPLLDKTAARKNEAITISKCVAAGIPLSSVADACGQ